MVPVILSVLLAAAVATIGLLLLSQNAARQRAVERKRPRPHFPLSGKGLSSDRKSPG